MENNSVALLIAVKDLVVQATREHEDIVMQSVKEICDMVVSKISAMNNNIVRHEYDSKRRNIVMYGIPEEEGETHEKTIGKVLDVVNSVMENNVNRYEVDNCFRLGRKNPKYLGRPVLVKFTSEWRKREMLRKGHTLKGRKLYVDEDYTKEVMEKRKHLIPTMMKLRKQNKHVILKKEKMYVDGVEWKEELETSSKPVVEESVKEDTSRRNKKKSKGNDRNKRKKYWK